MMKTEREKGTKHPKTNILNIYILFIYSGLDDFFIILIL